MKLLVTSVATRYYSIITQHLITVNLKTLFAWPCGRIDKASDLESEDCGFDPQHGRDFFASQKTQFVNNYYFMRAEAVSRTDIISLVKYPFPR